MRHRIEDLGRIAEKLERAVRMDIWDNTIFFPQNSTPEFFDLGIEEQREVIKKREEDLEELLNVIVSCHEIANGEDELNRADGPL